MQHRHHTLPPREAGAPLPPPDDKRGGAARAAAVGEGPLEGAHAHQSPPGREVGGELAAAQDVRARAPRAEREHRALQRPPPAPLRGEDGEACRGARRDRRPRAQRAPHAAAAAAAVHAPDGGTAEHDGAPAAHGARGDGRPPQGVGAALAVPLAPLHRARLAERAPTAHDLGE